MHRSVRNVLFLVLAAAVGVGLSAPINSTLSVHVRHGPVRERPTALGTVVAKLPYRSRVKLLQKSGESWLKVEPLNGNNPNGWMRASALTESRLAMKSGKGKLRASASGEELAMAGKGFSKDVEEQFRGRNPALERAYRLLDQIEAQAQFLPGPAEIAVRGYLLRSTSHYILGVVLVPARGPRPVEAYNAVVGTCSVWAAWRSSR